MQNSISEQARAAALAQLDAAEAAREDTLVQHIANGVAINSRTVQIDPEVVIAPGAVILAGTILRGKTVIGAGCVIGPNTLIEDSTVDEGTTVNASQIYGSHIGPHNNIGPFTHVRVNTVTDYGVHLGAYVETKNSNFARGNTVSHLTYIGDSDATTMARISSAPRSAITALSAATPTLWPRSRLATVPTPPPAAPSPKTCPRRRWASPGSARPIWRAGQSPRWKPTLPRKRSWKTSRASKLSVFRVQTAAQDGPARRFLFAGASFSLIMYIFLHARMLYLGLASDNLSQKGKYNTHEYK